MWCLARWTSDPKVGGSRPSPYHRIVSLQKILCPTLCLSTQVHKWVPVTYCWGVTLRWTGIQSRKGGGSSNILSCFMLWNQDKLRPCGTPWPECDLISIRLPVLNTGISEGFIFHCAHTRQFLENGWKQASIEPAISFYFLIKRE